MYRLLKLRNTNISTISRVSVSNYSSIHQRKCTSCNHVHTINRTQLLLQSTYTHPHFATKKNRKKRNKKPYTDTLIVKNSSSSEIKANICNLKPDDIKMLSLTNLNLNELYKLKNFLNQHSNDVVIEHSYNNLTDINSIPLHEEAGSLDQLQNIPITVNNSPVHNTKLPEEALEESELEESLDSVNVLTNPKSTHFQPEVVADENIDIEVEVAEEPEIQRNVAKPQAKIIPFGNTYRNARGVIIARTLAAYIEVCAGQKAPQRGLNAYAFYKHRSTHGKQSNGKYPPIVSVNVYNALLKGFAAKGDFRKLQEILALAREENVLLNVQSYAAIFECIGRVNYNDSHTRFIRTFTKEALQNEITFDRILNEASFLYDQREKVLIAMKSHDRNYQPKYVKPIVQYDNALLNELNHDVQLRSHEVDANKSSDSFFNTNMLEELIRKQLEVEKNVLVTIKSIESRPDVTKEVHHYRELWATHIKFWEDSTNEAFNRDLLALTAKRSPVNFDMYLRSIPAKDIVTIIVDEAKKIARGSETYSPTTSMLYRQLGSKVYARYTVLKKQKSGVIDKITQIHNDYAKEYAASHNDYDVLPKGECLLNNRQMWQWSEFKFKQEGATIHMDYQEWTPSALIFIGKFLYNIIMHDLKIDVNALRINSKHKNYLPAFYTIFRSQGRTIKEEVKPHPVLSKLYRASIPDTLTFPVTELPMYCPPVPWTSILNGGYLVAPCDVIRLPSQAALQKQRLKETASQNLYPTLDALNQLASVPWKVNTQILDVILEVFRKGGSSKLDVPKEPSSLPPPQPAPNDDNKSAKHAMFRQRMQYRRKKAEMYSLWCDCLYRLSLANHYRNDIFWLPHNMDFRGRVYPIPPHLNHLGSDLARSMLIFAESRPLGPKGLDWLKIHLVNLTGLKKRDSVDTRLQYAEEIMGEIRDSADNPLSGRQWWAASDEPWQTLACCMEIVAAERSGNPEEYQSHFPIHQDGSCNGLQHYAALGRDTAGAFSVNLSPAELPQDVYSTVASLVEETRQKDVASGMEIAKILEGYVRRKVIKQTVMTTVYGVTRFGARLQIARQLKDIESFPKEYVWSGSTYLTSRTFDSLRTMFKSTREIQDWLTDCARLISLTCEKNVEWITPLGLPVVQPYLSYKKLSNGYENFHMDMFEKPDVMKQKNAFPPNFIHSLDSSHMMLTSLYSERAGITFVSVHDCFWTHPSTVHIMNKVCREQFVALHSQPILEDLSNFLTESFSYHADEIQNDGSVAELTKRKLNRALRKLPKSGDFEINEVLDSVYFFS